jgi:hypothetical protein
MVDVGDRRVEVKRKFLGEHNHSAKRGVTFQTTVVALVLGYAVSL